MKTFFKIVIGFFALLVAMQVLGGFLGDDNDSLRKVKLAVEMDLEDAAKSKLNYSSTYDKRSFTLTDTKSYTKGDELFTEADAKLIYTGENAFGRQSTFVMTAEVQYNLETTGYKVINIKTK